MKGMIDIATLRVSPMAMANAKIFIPIPHYSIHHLLIYCNLQYLQDQLKCSQNFRYLEFLKNAPSIQQSASLPVTTKSNLTPHRNIKAKQLIVSNRKVQLPSLKCCNCGP